MMEPERIAPTRASLLSRLRSWDNDDSWREFFDTYWRLIYDVARKAGFNDAEAQDIVQDSLLSVAKQMPSFKYNRAEGSFKGWLLQITRRRIADQLRKKYRGGGTVSADAPEFADADNESLLMQGAVAPLNELWEEQWKAHIAEVALDRVKKRVKAAQFQIFDLSAIKGWPIGRVSEALGVSKTQVYLARQRVGALVKKEVRKLAEDGS